MDVKRKALTAAATTAVVAMACTSGAQLRVELHDRNDPSPKQVRIGAQIAGLCLGFLLSWSADGVRPTVRI